MRKLIRLVGLLALAAAAGCGNSTTLNTAPLTDEEKRKIKEEDQRIDEEERSGSGTKVPRKK
jgi:hypothetical protein